MAYTPVHNPHFECLKDIVRLIQARLRPDKRIVMNWGTRSGLHFISCKPLASPSIGGDVLEIERGIPDSALTVERIGPMAYGLIAYFRKRRPDWFYNDDIIPLTQG